MRPSPWLSRHGATVRVGGDGFFRQKQFDPEKKPLLVETNFPTPMDGRVVMLIYWRLIY
jgi:hypothetical protein